MPDTRTDWQKRAWWLADYSEAGQASGCWPAGMPVSRHTVLRRVKDAVRKSGRRRDIRVVGVDDWAWKKGQSFGTILVDLENHEVVDLLPPGLRKCSVTGWSNIPK